MCFNIHWTTSPGTTYTYSDLNMITLGEIIERISGKGLDEFIKGKDYRTIKNERYNV